MTVIQSTGHRPDNQAKILDEIMPLTQCGFRMFRCAEWDKKPLARGWQREATSDPDRLIRLFGGKPCNVGLATGRGLVVLDVDGQPGQESLDRLESEHGPLPETARRRTGSGGMHWLFRTSSGQAIRSRSGIRMGLDVKADGGLIVLPPSTHPSGRRYQWEQHPSEGIAPLPAWLHTLLAEPTRRGIPMGRARGSQRAV